MIHRCGKCTGVLDSAGTCHWCRVGRRPPDITDAQLEGERPKTTEEAIEDVREAWRELVLEAGKALCLDKLLDWFERKLKR